MAWTPAQSVNDVSVIADNLLTFIDTNQADAMAWAGIQSQRFAKLYPNAAGRLASIFPNLMIIRQRQANDFTGEILLSAVEITLEGAATSGDADELTITSKQMAMAVESMVLNMQPADLMLNSVTNGFARVIELETEFDILRGAGGRGATNFLQLWQTRIVWQIYTQGFS